MNPIKMTCRHCGKPARYSHMRIVGLDNGEQCIAAIYGCDDCDSEEMLQLFLHEEFAVFLSLHPSETEPVKRKAITKLRTKESYVLSSNQGGRDSSKLLANKALTNCILNNLGDSVDYRYSKADRCIYLYDGCTSKLFMRPKNKTAISIARIASELISDFGYGHLIVTHSVETDGSIKLELTTMDE